MQFSLRRDRLKNRVEARCSILALFAVHSKIFAPPRFTWPSLGNPPKYPNFLLAATICLPVFFWHLSFSSTFFMFSMLFSILVWFIYSLDRSFISLIHIARLVPLYLLIGQSTNL